MATTSLEHKVSRLEQKIRQLSNDIDSFIAKDRELLARLRNGRGSWRAMQRAREVSLHPYDEITLKVTGEKRDGRGGNASAFTADAVVVACSPAAVAAPFSLNKTNDANSI